MNAKISNTILVVINFATALAKTYYGSVETIAKWEVNAGTLHGQSLSVRAAFTRHLLENCGIVKDAIRVLSTSGAIQNTFDKATFDVAAGGFMGRTKAACGYTLVDDERGPGTIADDIIVLANSLGYVFTQGSTFVLDGNDSDTFGVPANYVVMVFNETPTLDDSRDFFELVGSVDSNMFKTGSSGYTQYGREYLSLQSAIPDQEFIDGYTEAGRRAGVTYTPVVDGMPSLYSGAAAFPINNWRRNPNGEEYLSRIPVETHDGLSMIRERVLSITRKALNFLKDHGKNQPFSVDIFNNLTCGHFDVAHEHLDTGESIVESDPERPDENQEHNETRMPGLHSDEKDDSA